MSVTTGGGTTGISQMCRMRVISRTQDENNQEDTGRDGCRKPHTAHLQELCSSRPTAPEQKMLPFPQFSGWSKVVQDSSDCWRIPGRRATITKTDTRNEVLATINNTW